MPTPAPERFLRVLDNVSGALGLGRGRLDADALISQALRQSGRKNFRDCSFASALQLLLECYEHEADLNLFGRHAARWDALRCLSNLLRFEAEEERHPDILEETIERPIFITGLPRSGTTLLHSLLALDSSLRVPRCWQTISPYPGKGADRRRAQVDRQLRLFQRLASEMAALHPLTADAPQECTEITAQVFQSLRYEMSHRVPSYQAWIDAVGHLPAYRFHKRFLQHLQHQDGGGRWVLKCPDHIHALNAIGTVYPDCGIVFVHRDPLRVIASAVKLTEVVRKPFTRHVDKREIGQQVLGRVTEGAQTMIETSKAHPRGRIFHVHYTAFAHNPLETIAALYRHFDLQLTEDVRERMRAHLAAASAGSHHYSMEEFALDPAQLRDRFGAYVEHFGIRRESDIWQSPGNPRVPIAA
jgi:hypothetical protein